MLPITITITIFNTDPITTKKKGPHLHPERQALHARDLPYDLT